MDNEILVSICCTAYNHAPYLRQTLDSFLEQKTDFRFEILVNDDVSTDETASIMREYAARYPDIVRPFYQKENLFSRYIDIYHTVFYPVARGRYIAMCEGDDYWCDPQKLQRQVDFLEAHPDYSACVHNSIVHYCAGDKPDHPLLKRSGDCDVRFEDLITGMSEAFHFSSIVGRKAIMENAQDFYYVGLRCGFSDQPEALWLYVNGPIRYLDACMSVYRVNSGSASWSSGVDGQYDKLREFTAGKCEILRAFRPYAPKDKLAAVDRMILEREFELMYIEGRDREQRKPPYDELLRAMPPRYRFNNWLKCTFPRAQRLYRRMRGYGR